MLHQLPINKTGHRRIRGSGLKALVFLLGIFPGQWLLGADTNPSPSTMTDRPARLIMVGETDITHRFLRSLPFLSAAVLGNPPEIQRYVEDLVHFELLVQKARADGIHVDPEEVKAILDGAQAAPAEYGDLQEALKAAREKAWPAEDQRAYVEERILVKRLQRKMTDSVVAREEDVRERFRLEEDRALIRWVGIEAAKFAVLVKPSLAQLEKLYAANPSRFNLGETRQVRLLAWDMATELVRLGPLEQGQAMTPEDRAKQLLQRARENLRQKARLARSRLLAGEEWAQAAREMGALVVNLSPMERSRPDPLVRGNASLLEEVFSTGEGWVGYPFENEQVVYLPGLIAIRGPHTPSFAEAGQRLEKAWQDEESHRLAAAEARRFLTEAQRLGLAETAKTWNLTVRDSQWIARRFPAEPEIRQCPALVEAVFATPKDGFGGPVLMGGEEVVFQVVGRQSPQEKIWVLRNEDIRNGILYEKRQLLLRNTLRTLKSEYEAKGRIRIQWERLWEAARTAVKKQ